jgi:hypothetical protein
MSRYRDGATASGNSGVRTARDGTGERWPAFVRESLIRRFVARGPPAVIFGGTWTTAFTPQRWSYRAPVVRPDLARVHWRSYARTVTR